MKYTEVSIERGETRMDKSSFIYYCFLVLYQFCRLFEIDITYIKDTHSNTVEGMFQILVPQLEDISIKDVGEICVCLLLVFFNSHKTLFHTLIN